MQIFTSLNHIWDKVRAKVRDKVTAKVWDKVRDKVRASFSWTCQSGDSGWGSWTEYYQKIGILDGKEDGLKEYLGYLKSGAFFVSFWEDEAIVMERPTECHFDGQDRLHSLTSPALAFKDGSAIYAINGVEFDKDLWQKVTKDKLSAKEVFALENTEQRRIAYELMDKKKMLDLDDYKVLDSREKDEQGNPDKVISFNVKGFDKPFLYYNCFCPTTKREYFLQTEKEKCIEAKESSFGLKDIKWTEEF